jgi:hypothetical protein
VVLLSSGISRASDDVMDEMWIGRLVAKKRKEMSS